jgi:cobalt-zinc-cadmium efflux system membrane fusion protein
MNRQLQRHLLVVALGGLGLVAGCPDRANETKRQDMPAPAPSAAPVAKEAQSPTVETSRGSPTRDHGEISDLDRPVAELFADSCEHEARTFQCDQCRSEVGVVKAPESLFKGGLLETAKPARKPIAVPLQLTGEVRFDERRVAHVSTLAEGIIKRVHVTLGDKVKQGQPLLEIESVAVGEAQAAYLEAKGMLSLAQRNHDRIAALRDEKIAAQKELFVAQRELDAARIRVDAALGKLRRLGMSAAGVRALTQKRSTGRLVLRAPAGGTVLALHAVAGEVARSETSLATVGDNSALWVWADLYERDVALVAREQARRPLAAEVEVKAFAGERFTGVVDFISPSMSKASRTVKLRIATPNPTGRLLAGMFANVSVFVPGNEQVLTVPEGAVLEDEGRTFVFLHHQDDYYVRRPVAVGRTFAGVVEVASGLQGEETIVAEGSFLLKSDVLRSKIGAGCAD